MRIFVSGAGYAHWGKFHASDMEKEDAPQIGGGETAMIKMAEALAARNHEVFVFANMQPGHHKGVDYLPADDWVRLGCMMRHDVSVAWDTPAAMRFDLKSDARVVAYQLNDTYVGVLDNVIDRYFCPSEWHARRYQEEVTPEVDASKFRPRMTNAVDMSRYADSTIERDSSGVVWSSSPDRGLHHLLAAWPLIKQREPKARLHIFYDMKGWFQIIDEARAAGQELITSDWADQVRRGLALTEDMNVQAHGGVSKSKLAKAQMGNTVGFASLDVVAPTEGFGMTMLEVMAAGMYPIAGTVDAFPELWADVATLLDNPSDPETVADAVCAGLQDPVKGRKRRRRVARGMSWDFLGEKWEKEFNELTG